LGHQGEKDDCLHRRNYCELTHYQLFCLDPATGDIRWQNPLKGLGRRYITIAASGNEQAIVHARQEAAR
jgi:hypothetical protein